jgi:hypothetical protein
MSKRKKIWTSDAERRAWDAKVDADIRHARQLVRKAWAEMGISEPEDSVAYAQGLVDRAQAKLAERRAPEQPA